MPDTDRNVTVLLSPEGLSTAKADPSFDPADGKNRSADLPIPYPPGQTLAQAVYLSGYFAPPALCSGLSLCGRCRMRILSAPPDPVPADKRLFSPEELAHGWRLACRHRPAPGMHVELPTEVHRFSDLLAASLPGNGGEPCLPSSESFDAVLAVDLGTTSMQWRHQLLSSDGYTVLGQGGIVNPQMGAGSDVISRLSVAAGERGRERLSQLTLEALQDLVGQCAVAAQARGLPGAISAVCLSANTANTAITLGLDTMGLARVPYSMPYAGGCWEELPGLPRIWFPPQLAPFVGVDVASGYAALALDPARPIPAHPFLLADLGTNGEFLLVLSPDRALTASVALGPALEGIGLRHGTEARPGAVSAFSLSPQGLQAVLLPGAARNEANSGCLPPVPPIPGITGTGYLSLLNILLTIGAMDRQGRFTPENSGLLKRLFAQREAGALRDSSGEAWLSLPFGLHLTASDVEEILKVKAAFSLGLRRLLDKAGLASGELARVYVAGALGSHVEKHALEELGFFPQGMAARLEAVGNTSLEGAALLLREPRTRRALVRWSKKVEPLDLASDHAFTQGFADHMRFVW